MEKKCQGKVGKSLERICPSCKGKIIYSSPIARYNAERKNCLCKSCSRSGEKNPMFGKIGKLNPNFGVPCSEERRVQMSKDRKGKPIHTKESKKKISDWQIDNAPMRGRSVYSVWVEKYGVDEAEKRMASYKEKQRLNSSGENNPMFGKPSPKGSGNGWSGWYLGRFFRSLRELMFLIYAERYSIPLESGESKKYAIQYLDFKGKLRNYFPDYIIKGKYLIEIKPKKLWGSPKNIAKFKASEKFCQDNNLKIKLIDPRINSKLIKQAYLEGKIKFLPVYEERFKNWS